MSEPAKCCLNCGSGMLYMKREHIQLGKNSWFLGDWSNLLAGALEVDIWACPDCGKLEFYLVRPVEAETDAEEGHILQIPCPNCGYEHDLDDPKCPRCGSRNVQMEEPGDRMLQITCPDCGCRHDLDDPKCPFCGSKNTQM